MSLEPNYISAPLYLFLDSPIYFGQEDGAAVDAVDRGLARWSDEKDRFELTDLGRQVLANLENAHLLRCARTRHGVAWYIGAPAMTQEEAQARRINSGRGVELLTGNGWIRARFETSSMTKKTADRLLSDIGGTPKCDHAALFVDVATLYLHAPGSQLGIVLHPEGRYFLRRPT